MPEERGGYQRPSKSSSYSGVGARSKRTDGRQAVKSPNVQDSTDLQVGDRERIRQGQTIAPLSETPSPRLAAPPRGGATPTAGGGAVPPEFLFSMPGPDAPMAIPQEPQDEVEVILQGLAQITGDLAISQMFSEHREFKAWKSTGQTPTPQMQAPIADIEQDLDEPAPFDLATEGVTGDEEVDQTSVETSPVPSEGGEDVGAGLSPQEIGGNPEMV